MTEHANSTASSASAAKRSKIQQWLSETGWRAVEVTHPDALWLFKAFDDMGHGFIVVQPKATPDQITIQSSIEIDPDRQRALLATNDKVRQEMIWEMRTGILAIGLDFSGIADPLRVIGLTQHIFDDGLTKDAFVQRVLQVKRGVAFVFGCVLKHLQEPPPRELNTKFVH